MKYCVDCKYFEKEKSFKFLSYIPIIGWCFAYWLNKDAIKFGKCNKFTTDVVQNQYLSSKTTEKYQRKDYASVARLDCGQCKPEGIYFAAKK